MQQHKSLESVASLDPHSHEVGCMAGEDSLDP